MLYLESRLQHKHRVVLNFMECLFKASSLMYGLGGAQRSTGLNTFSTRASTNLGYLSDRILRDIHNKKNYVQSVDGREEITNLEQGEEKI